MDYFTLRALAAEWDRDLRGALVAEAYTQQRGELSLALEAAGGAAWTVRVGCEGAARGLVWRSEGHGRARRNTAAVFEPAAGRRVAGVRTAERDRLFYVDLEGGGALLAQPFGPRPNVFLVDAGDVVAEAFLADAEWAGRPAPRPRPAPEIGPFEAFAARWRADRPTVAQALAGAAPLIPRPLAAEAARRAGLDQDAAPGGLGLPALHAVFDAARQLETELTQAPRPRIYWRGAVPEALALVPLSGTGWREEPFETVDAAARVWAQRRLAAERFLAAYRPVEAALAAAAARLARSAEAMTDELARPSRADRYEAWGHVLMAGAAGEGPGRDAITLPDVMSDGAPVTIPLDPALSAIENAGRLYARARQSRAQRAHAEARWARVASDAEAAQALLGRLRGLDRYDALQAFLDAEKDALARLVRPEALGDEALPYRRFVLAGGWEARVGKNAASNAALTRSAGPHDLWLHARGVGGSHVVLRRPSRTATPGRAVVEAAAALAAHFSQARGQALVPVQVAERKYVRPVKGGPPGAVRVEREEVLIVEPRLPGGAQPPSA